MQCPDCKGTGDGGVGKPCFRCDGDGELCDKCGESLSACHCEDDEDDEAEGRADA